MGRAGALALMLLLVLACSARAAQAADRIYWANSSDRFGWANLDGTGGGDLPLGRSVMGASGIAIDAAAGRLYWANNNEHDIFYLNLDGSGGGGPLNTAGATFARPGGLAIDHAAGRIYWANFDANTISYANLDGSGGHDVPTGPLNNPAGLALDPAGGRIYWDNFSPGGFGIAFARLDGSGRGIVFTTGATVNMPVGLALDPAGQRIYWANTGGGISFARLDAAGGDDLSISGAQVNAPAGLAIDPTAGRIYWSNFGGGAISSANLDGSGAADLPIPNATASGPSFLALLKSPAADDVPDVTGGAKPGSVLSCSPGTWAPDLPASQLYRAPQSATTYQWGRGRLPIAGATGPTYKATVGGQYRCAAIASNAAGRSINLSDPHIVLAAPDLTRPRITAFTIEPSAFSAASGGPSIAKATGTTVKYTLSEAASSKFTVRRAATGAKRGSRCVAAAPVTGSAVRCTRYVSVPGSFSRKSAGGITTFRFTGRLGSRSLPPGRYRLSARARDATGNESAPARRSFRILP